MNNKVYYGEYSLKHWIDLMLKENIILPDYQRRFVWKQKDVKGLINAFKEKQFVPPVTIGAFTIEGKPQNLILDGQQRLTSVLLAHLGLYPNKEKWEKMIEQSADENDDEKDDEQPNKEIKWKFKELTNIGKNKDDILNKISTEYQDCYDDLKLDFNVDDDFLKKTFLGFSYLVPANTSDKNAQQEYYSTVFRHINIQGVNLSPQESRAALYFLDEDKTKFFEPDYKRDNSSILFNTFKVNDGALDFVKYLSLLSQYYKDGSEHNIARGYGNKQKLEEYYEKYIHSTVKDEDSEIFGKFSNIFPDKNYHTRFESLRQTLKDLDFSKTFSSIIDLDLYFFGLIYEVVFENKKIDVSKKNDLERELKNKSNKFKQDNKYTRAPAALKYLRPRIAASIEIYRKYVEE